MNIEHLSAEIIQESLRKYSYGGNCTEFTSNLNNHYLYELLLNLYGRADTFLSSIPFLHYYGTYTCKEMGCLLRKAIETVGSYALEGRSRHIKPLYSNVNLEQLIFEREGKLTFDVDQDIKFWETAIETIYIGIEGLPESCLLLDIFDVIAKIERKLRLKGCYKRKYVLKPRGYVVARGSFTFNNGIEMKKIGSSLKKQEVLIDFRDGSLNWDSGKVCPKSFGRLMSKKLQTEIQAKSIKYLHGECGYEIIMQPESNASYLHITNPTGRELCFLYYENRVSDAPEIYLESDMSFKFKNEFDLSEIIETYKEPKRTVLGLVTPIITEQKNDFFALPFNHKGNTSVRERKLVMKKKAFISPLTKDNVFPTILASQNNVTFDSTLSLGNHPNTGVIEIVPSLETGSEFSLDNPYWILSLGSPLFKRKNGFNNSAIESIIRKSDKYRDRKITNKNLSVIINEIRKMKSYQKITVRPLTPKEKFRVMGMPERYINKILKLKMAKTRLNHVAGNSIAPPVLVKIFESMFIPHSLRKQIA